MKVKEKVFIDSDVFISAVISNKGASNLLLTNKWSGYDFVISNISVHEIKIVSNRLNLSSIFVNKLLKKLEFCDLIDGDLLKYQKYVLDVNDAHVVSGTVTSGSRFLLTYNQKHFKIDLLKDDFSILVMTPAMFLQYYRSICSTSLL